MENTRIVEDRDLFLLDGHDDDKFHDECGVVGIYSKDPAVHVGTLSYLALYALQHRGQESAGIATFDGDRIHMEKGMGLVSDVFDEAKVKSLKGFSSVGHVRYSTAGGSSVQNAQPIYSKFKQGEIAVAHNGQLINVEILREMFEDLGYSFETTSDSEIIIKMIARAAKKGIERAIDETIKTIKGSYALTMIVDEMLVGVRDPQGIRPLAIGKIGENGYILASETCAFDCVGATYLRDVEPGEIVIIDDNGLRSIQHNERTYARPCSFEYVYFARPDSTIDGVNVHESRKKAGAILWVESPVEADVVVGVPDSGLDAALGLAVASGIPYDIGLVKNKYVGRSFIMPDQQARERAVHIKLSAMRSVVSGKRIILVDDSIVRGTTSRQLVNLMKEAGAKEVHMRIPSPVVSYPCYFGIDTPYRDQLIGAKMSVDEMCEHLGADSLAFLSQDGLVNSIRPGGRFCLGCFTGQYPMSVQMEGE